MRVDPLIVDLCRSVSVAMAIPDHLSLATNVVIADCLPPTARSNESREIYQSSEEPRTNYGGFHLP